MFKEGDRVHIEDVIVRKMNGTVEAVNEATVEVVWDEACSSIVPKTNLKVGEEHGDMEVPYEKFNKLNPAQEERLDMLAEECAEIIQTISKIKLHGYESYHPDDPDMETNAEALARECGDAAGVLEHLLDHGDIDAELIDKSRRTKMHRSERYMHYHEHSPLTTRELLFNDTQIWTRFYRDGWTLGQIAKEWNCSVYDLSPWLTKPLTTTVQQVVAETERDITQYKIGDITMASVFAPTGMTNISDLQAVFDRIEIVLAALQDKGEILAADIARIPREGDARD